MRSSWSSAAVAALLAGGAACGCGGAGAQGPDATPDGIACPAVAGATADNPLGITFTRVVAGIPELPGAGHSGVAVDDLDGDGDLDVAIARAETAFTGAPGGASGILWNDGPSPSGFVVLRRDLAVEALTAGHACQGVATGDLDRDRDVDLVFACLGPVLVLANDGVGVFTDVTSASGLVTGAGHGASTPILADVNTDGLLDVYLAASGLDILPENVAQREDHLFLGRAGGRFEDVSDAVVRGYGIGWTALAGNLDADPEPEILVANDRLTENEVLDEGLLGPDGLPVYQGNALLDLTGVDAAGVPTYVDRAQPLCVVDLLGQCHELTGGIYASMGILKADLDEDGDDDLYVSDDGPNHVWLWDAAAGEYVDDNGALGLDLGQSPEGAYVTWSVVASDLDRDGHLEVSATTGHTMPNVNCAAFAQRDFFLRADPGRAFVDITADVGLPAGQDCAPRAEPINGRSGVYADLDGDGDDDLIVAPYGETYAFYVNETPTCGRTALRVRPVGTVSPREATGTRLVVTLSDGRTVTRTLDGGGLPFSQADRVLELGLDGAGPDVITEAHLEWPGGFVQRLDDRPDFAAAIAGAQTLSIEEPEWLTVSARSIAPGESVELIVRGDAITARAQTRLDGGAETTTATPVEDLGDGRHRIAIAHPGTPGSVRVTLTDAARPILLAPVIAFTP